MDTNHKCKAALHSIFVAEACTKNPRAVAFLLMKNTKNKFCTGWKTKIFVSFIDAIHRVKRPFNQPKPPETIHKILLCNWSSLGDVFLSTSVIPEIKARFPNCKIGFLVSKYSRMVLDTTPDIDWIHETEVWARAGKSGLQKILGLFKFQFLYEKKIIEELTKKKYDCAIDLYPYYPNTIPILWKAKIPIRIGFNTGGGSFLLSTIVPWESEQYIPFHYAHIFGIEGPLKIPINTTKPQTVNLKKPYLIFHTGSSLHLKEFSLDFWKSLYSICRAANYTVYFTGRGEKENRFIEAIAPDYNLCNRLSWSDLICVIRESIGVVSVDSVPVHISAALDVPFAVLYKTYSKIWHPDCEKGTPFGINEPIQVEKIFEVIQSWIYRLMQK